jgi:hypothetical protein
VRGGEIINIRVKKPLILLTVVLVFSGALFFALHLVTSAVPPLEDVQSFVSEVPERTGWESESSGVRSMMVNWKPRSLNGIKSRLGMDLSERELFSRFITDEGPVTITLFVRREKIAGVRVDALGNPGLAEKAEGLLLGRFPTLSRVMRP